MNLLSLVLLFAALAAGTKLIVLASVWLKIRRVRLRPCGVELCEPGELPPEITPLLEHAASRLQELEFVFSHAQWTDSVVVTEGPRPYRVYHHPWTGTYATVGPPIPGSGDRSFQVGFTTAFEDGSVVATFDGVAHLALTLPPCWESYDHKLNDLDRQWEAHQAAIRDRIETGQPVGYSPEEFALREGAMLRETLTAWRESRLITPAGPDTPDAAGRAQGEARWRMTPAAAWDLARRTVAEHQRMARSSRAARLETAAAHRLERSGGAPPVGPAALGAGAIGSQAVGEGRAGSTESEAVPASPRAADRIAAPWPHSLDAESRHLDTIASLERFSTGAVVHSEGGNADADREAHAAALAWEFEYLRDAKEKRRRSLRGKTLAFLLTSGLFALALGLFASWRLVGFIFVAILIHELGHLAGMAAFGYRDRQIFFLPFLGAAAVGRNPAASAWQRTIVYLLGPVPGLLLGVICLYFFRHGGASWWLEFGIVVLALNYLNLLPFVPLDGGRVVETLILSRFPRAQAAFLAVGAVVFGWVAWRFADPVLGVLAFVLLVALPAKWRWAAAVRRIAPRITTTADRSEKLKAVFDTLSAAPFETLPAATRIGMADGILEHFETRPATPATALGGVLLYAALMIAPIVLATPYVLAARDVPVAEEATGKPGDPRVDQASFILPEEIATGASGFE